MKNRMSGAPEISRVARSKAEARAAYDRMSAWYDCLAGQSEKKFRDIGLQKLNAGKGETILEIGCGTGHALIALARAAGDSGKVYGIDLSAGMVRIAQARVEEMGLTARVQLECGDAAGLPYASEQFDAIFICFTLELFDTPEIPVVLGECRRVLRNGGRIGVVALSRPVRSGPMIRLYEWAHQQFPAYVDCRPIFVQAALQENGFQVHGVDSFTMWGLPVDIVLAGKN